MLVAFSPFDDLFQNPRILRITWPQAGTAGKPADTKDSYQIYQALAPCFIEKQKDADAYP